MLCLSVDANGESLVAIYDTLDEANTNVAIKTDPAEILLQYPL